MTETEKLRALLAEYHGYLDARDWGRRSPSEMLTLIQAQAVLALAEQLDRQTPAVGPVHCSTCGYAVYRCTACGIGTPPRPETEVTCRVCHGTGRGFGYETLKPCPGCGGAGKVRVT